MIFVSVGTQKFPLDRLLKEIDLMVENKSIDEDVFAQIGNSTYKPKNYRYEKFLSPIDFEKVVKKSDLIVTHSGVATIITSLKNAKPVVVFPRLSKYGEHVDDHQVQIAHTFADKNYVACCDDEDDLSEVIKKARQIEFDTYVSKRTEMVNEIKEYLHSL